MGFRLSSAYGVSHLRSNPIPHHLRSSFSEGQVTLALKVNTNRRIQKKKSFKIAIAPKNPVVI